MYETEGDTSEENAEQAFKHNIFYVALDSIISDLTQGFRPQHLYVTHLQLFSRLLT